MANSTIASSNNVSRPLSKHSNQKHLSTLISSLSTLTFEYEYESEFFLPFEYEYCEFESNTLIFESEYDLVEPLAVVALLRFSPKEGVVTCQGGR